MVWCWRSCYPDDNSLERVSDGRQDQKQGTKVVSGLLPLGLYEGSGQCVVQGKDQSGGGRRGPVFGSYPREDFGRRKKALFERMRNRTETQGRFTCTITDESNDIVQDFFVGQTRVKPIESE